MKNNLKYLVALLLATTSFAGIDPSNNFKLGDGQASDKKVTFNKGIGAANPIIKWDEASGKLQFCNDGVTCTDFGTGSGGGSSFPPYTSLVDYLNRAETSTMPRVSTQLFDTFNSSKGTLSNTQVSGSKLSLSGVNTSGSYTYDKQFTSQVDKFAGVVNMALQTAAPTTDAIVSNQILFTGDVTALFPVNKNIIEYIHQQSGAETVHTYLRNALGKVATLEVTAASYSGITGKTTITVSNPESLDLTMGVAAIDNNTKLRFSPFDYQFKVKTSSGGSYEDVTVDDADTTGNIKIPGQNYFAKLFSITGTIINTQADCSPSQVYCIVRVLEDTAGNSDYHFGYTTDSGKTWSDLGTKSASADLGADYASNFHQDIKQIIVADNGKAFWLYYNIHAGNIAAKAVYANLASSPVLTDTPATGVNTFNVNGASTGWIWSYNTTHIISTIDGDRTDLSLVAIGGNAANNGGYLQYFTNGGASYGPGVTANIPWDYPQMGNTFVSGTSGSHRITLFVDNPSDNYIGSYYIDEGSLTVSSRTLVFGSVNRNLYAFAGNQSTGKVYLAAWDASTLMTYVSGNVTGTPTYSSVKSLTYTNQAPDLYAGTDTSSIVNWHKGVNKRIIINPSDDNSFIFTSDMVHPDSRVRNELYEVRSDSGFQGAHITQFSTNTSNGLNDDTSRQKLSQTFLMTANRFRTFGARVFQTGNIPLGSQMTAKIFATSAGLPTGSALYTSPITYDPSNLTKDSNGQIIYFPFDTPALTNGVTYAVVIEATYALSASNFVAFRWQNSDVYANGALYFYNGSVWGAAGGDLAFEINGEFLYDLATNGFIGVSDSVYPYREDVVTTETQIKSIDSSNVQWITRRVPNRSNASFFPLNGDIFRSVFTYGSGGTVSTFTAPVGMGVANHEKFLIWNVSNGNTDNAQRNRLTSVVDMAKLSEDRSGYGIANNSYDNITSGDYGSDAQFLSGKYLSCNGSNQGVSYGHTATGNVKSGIPFYIEFEFIPTSVAASNYVVVSKYDSAASHGWEVILGMSNSGDLAWNANDSGGGSLGITRTTGGFVAAGTYYVIRVVYDGTLMHIYKATSPSGSFTEATYAVQAGITTLTSSATALRICSPGAGAGNYTPAKMGYVKMANGTATPSYAGYKPQYVITHPMNLGKLGVFGELHNGTTENSLNVSYNSPGFLSPTPNEASLVDSYEDQFYLNYSITAPGTNPFFQINLGRGSVDNPSYLGGYNLFFGK